MCVSFESSTTTTTTTITEVNSSRIAAAAAAGKKEREREREKLNVCELDLFSAAEAAWIFRDFPRSRSVSRAVTHLVVCLSLWRIRRED